VPNNRRHVSAHRHGGCGLSRLETVLNRDNRKTKAQLVQELERAQLRIAELEASASECWRAETDERNVSRFLQTLIDTIPSPIFYKDSSGVYLGCNQAFAAYLGLSRQEIVGKGVFDVAPPELAARYHEMDQALFRQPGVQVYEASVMFADGSVHEVCFNKATFTNGDGSLGGIVGVMLDITERKRGEEALRRSRNQLEQKVAERTRELLDANVKLQQEVEERRHVEEVLRESRQRYRNLMETMNEGLAIQDEKGTITFVNQKLCELSGYTQDELVGHSVNTLIEQMDQDSRCLLQEQLLRRKRGERGAYEISWTRRDGQKIIVIVSPVPFVDGDGRFLGSFAVMTDITARKQAEDALRESERQLRHLSTQLLTAQETERKRIAGELHDAIGQYLSAIKFGVEHSLQLKGKGKLKAMTEALEALVPMIRQTIDAVRTIYMDLRPSLLDDLGILATINWICRDFASIYKTVRIEKHLELHEQDVPESLKIIIFRIVQEALNNVAKHSQASLVNLVLRNRGGAIELLVEDNGQGFNWADLNVREDAVRGMGLISMKERAELSGGALEVTARPGGGTSIRVTWPPGQ
jgi:PAS domain S-box-containing protein